MHYFKVSNSFELNLFKQRKNKIRQILSWKIVHFFD